MICPFIVIQHKKTRICQPLRSHFNTDVETNTATVYNSSFHSSLEKIVMAINLMGVDALQLVNCFVT